MMKTMIVRPGRTLLLHPSRRHELCRNVQRTFVPNLYRKLIHFFYSSGKKHVVLQTSSDESEEEEDRESTPAPPSRKVGKSTRSEAYRDIIGDSPSMLTAASVASRRKQKKRTNSMPKLTICWNLMSPVILSWIRRMTEMTTKRR